MIRKGGTRDMSEKRLVNFMHQIWATLHLRHLSQPTTCTHPQPGELAVSAPQADGMVNHHPSLPIPNPFPTTIQTQQPQHPQPTIPAMHAIKVQKQISLAKPSMKPFTPADAQTAKVVLPVRATASPGAIASPEPTVDTATGALVVPTQIIKTSLTKGKTQSILA